MNEAISRWARGAVVAAACLAAAGAARAGARVAAGDDKELEVGLLLQPQLRLEQDRTADGRHWSYDPTVRRVRIMLRGRYTDLVNFFVETDSPNWGYRGDWSTRLFIQDAFVEFNLHEALQIDLGMLLVPFSHHGMQGATTLLMVDYHAALIKYPPGSNQALRDAGIMARGLLADGRLGYRLAVTNGVQSRELDDGRFVNRLDYPWITGRLTFNLFEPESGPGLGGYFWDGLYLEVEGDRLVSPRRVLSFGGGATWQAGLRGAGGKHDFLGLVADVFLDLPLGDRTQSLNGQVNYYWYEHGDGDPATGHGLLAELGYRFGRLQPVAGVEWFDAAAGLDGDLVGVRGGVNWWLFGFAANLKVELGAVRSRDADPSTNDDFELTGVLQAQVLL